MAGVKGRSGRKSRFAEIKVAELADMSVTWAIENFKTMPRDDKMKILTALAPKAIPLVVDTPDGNIFAPIQVEIIKNADQINNCISEELGSQEADSC